MHALQSTRTAIFLGACALGCGSSSNGPETSPSPVQELTVVGTYCTKSDARSCLVLTREELAVGSEGPCLHVVFENRCDQVVYSDTKIGYTHANRGPFWQGWISTTLPGALVDVSACSATGRYTMISSFSSGQLDILSTECPTTP